MNNKMKFKVGDKVTVFSDMQFQLPIFKKCEVTAYPVKIGIIENCVQIKTSNGMTKIVRNFQCKPYIEPKENNEKENNNKNGRK